MIMMHLLKHFMYDKHTQTYLIFISHLTATCTKTTKIKMFNLLKTIKKHRNEERLQC